MRVFCPNRTYGRVAAVIFGVVLLALSPQIQAKGLFETLLDEAGMSFTPPPNYLDVGAVENPLLAYEHAVSHPAGLAEVRYVVRPLSRLSVDYDDPHGAAPNPNEMYPLLFESLSNMLAGGRTSVSNVYPETQARERFGADWAAAAVLDPEVEFGGLFGEALIVAMHKHHLADAYIVLLYNNFDEIRDQMPAIMSSLRFTQPDP